MRLNELSDNPGATKKRKRVGRGIGSGKGKTAGRGVKGQKSRSGVAINGFEGGQMPIHMRLPKRGFNKPNRKRYAELSIATINRAIESGKIKAGDTLDASALVKAGVIRRAHDGVRIIGNGELKADLNFHVAGATKGAQGIVEGAKGSITIVEGKPERSKADGDAKPKKAKAAKRVETAAKSVVKTVASAVETVAEAVESAAEKVADVAEAVADKAENVAEGADDLSLIDGAGPAAVKKMLAAGITSFKQLAEMGEEQLQEALGKIAVTKEFGIQAQELLDGKPPRAKVDQKAAAKKD